MLCFFVYDVLSAFCLSNSYSLYFSTHFLSSSFKKIFPSSSCVYFPLNKKTNHSDNQQLTQQASENFLHAFLYVLSDVQTSYCLK